jgi:hypothetical protein
VTGTSYNAEDTQLLQLEDAMMKTSLKPLAVESPTQTFLEGLPIKETGNQQIDVLAV